jgi:hypothetical protein
MSASQSRYAHGARTFTYGSSAGSTPGSMPAACSRSVTHVPCPPQPAAHARRAHAGPSKPGSHAHAPVRASHAPRPEHSTGACAVSTAVATSAHAGPSGHARSEQSPPCQPAKHAQRDTSTQRPCPVHMFGHAARVEGRERRAARAARASGAIFGGRDAEGRAARVAQRKRNGMALALRAAAGAAGGGKREQSGGAWRKRGRRIARRGATHLWGHPLPRPPPPSLLVALALRT